MARVAQTGAHQVRLESPPRERHLRLVHPLDAVEHELRQLREVEERGDSGATALIVVAQVMATILLAVIVELALTFPFYFGWL